MPLTRSSRPHRIPYQKGFPRLPSVPRSPRPTYRRSPLRNRGYFRVFEHKECIVISQHPRAQSEQPIIIPLNLDPTTQRKLNKQMHCTHISALHRSYSPICAVSVVSYRITKRGQQYDVGVVAGYNYSISSPSSIKSFAIKTSHLAPITINNAIAESAPSLSMASSFNRCYFAAGEDHINNGRKIAVLVCNDTAFALDATVPEDKILNCATMTRGDRGGVDLHLVLTTSAGKKEVTTITIPKSVTIELGIKSSED